MVCPVSRVPNKSWIDQSKITGRFASLNHLGSFRIKAIMALNQAAVKVKHDWYQTDSTIVISILARNMREADVRVVYGNQTLSCTLHYPDNSNWTVGFNLAHQIVPAQSSHRVGSTKVEIKLKKLEDIRWSSLEGSGAADQPPTFQEMGRKDGGKDWDKVVVELTQAEEKPEGEAALNALFQQIYGDGSDDVRRAMNKSFVESGGTVLSTVWKDVGKDKVEVKPPEGMEWRKWDE